MADAKVMFRAASLEETRSQLATFSTESLDSILSWNAYQPWTMHSITERIRYIVSGESIDFPLPGIPAGTLWTEDNFWIAREAIRFNYELYEPLWFYKKVMGLRNDLWWHFPHMSIDDPSMIAYTPSAEYGKRDRQVRMKVGKYLTQFYGERLSAGVIRDIVNACKKLEIKWAVTADEIAYVYTHGPSSCMSGDNWGSVHPTMVYEGEFRLAYLERSDVILARGLVHDPSMSWVRVYGEEADTLAGALNAAGFTKESGWPDGAKLKRVMDRHHNVMMPYIDGSSRGIRETRNGGFAITDRDYVFWADSTTGIYSPGGIDECEHCGDHYYAENEGGYSDYHNINICASCCENVFTWAVYDRHGNQTYVNNDDVVSVNDTWYANDQRVLGAHNIVECAFSSDYFTKDNMVELCNGDLVGSEHALPCGVNEYGEDMYATPDIMDRNWSVAVALPDGPDAETFVYFILHPDYDTTYLRERAASMGLVVETALEYAKRVRFGSETCVTYAKVQAGGNLGYRFKVSLQRTLNSILYSYVCSGEEAAAAA